MIGKNGTGKSTFIDALTFCLFGKSFRKIRKNQLINSINKKDCLVEVNFKIKNDSYSVVRGIKPDVFEIYKNDEMLEQNGSNNDYQDLLENKILNINYKTFTQIVILGSSSYVPFMKLPAAQRRELIEDMLNLNQFSIMKKMNSDNLKDIEIDIAKCDSSMESMKNSISDNEDILKNSEQKEKERKEKDDKKIEEYKKEIEKHKKDILNYKSKLVELSDIDSLRDKLKKIEKIIIQTVQKNNDFDMMLNFMKSNDICPTCGQNIDDNHKHDQIKLFDEQKNKLKPIDVLRNAEKKLKSQIKNEEKKKFENEQLKLKIHNLTYEIKNCEDYIELIQISHTKSINSELISDNIKSYKEKLKKLEILNKKHKKKKEIYTNSSYLFKDDGIKSHIIEKYVPIINKCINKYLYDMNFHIDFHFDSKFNETLRSRYRDEFSYENFSEGERMRIDLSLLLCWREITKYRNSVNTNLLILDEVFDASLDSSGCDDFMNLLKTEFKDLNCFIISHNPENIEDMGIKILNFKKKDNFSEIQV